MIARVDLKEKDWINSHHRESAVTKYKNFTISIFLFNTHLFSTLLMFRYNSANLPASFKPEDVSTNLVHFIIQFI